MFKEKTVITEDRMYKKSDPEMPDRKFHIETEEYRWEVYVRQWIIRETGTPVYYGRVGNEYSAYGLTVNEVLNDLASILVRMSESRPKGLKTVSLSEVRYFLDPSDVIREEMKITDRRPGKSILARLLGL
ncbi:MAG: hypothetical protein AABY87_04525 [bacterium]